MVAPTEPKDKTHPVAPGEQAALVRCLQKSALFRAYRQAFEATTGLPLVFRAAGSFLAPLQGSKRANPFCGLMIESGKTCAACLQLQHRVETKAIHSTKSLQCHAGLVESAVPVRVGDLILGYLQTGQVFLRPPTRLRFDRIVRSAPAGDWEARRRQLEPLYFQTPLIGKDQYQAILRLLVIFAEHLASVSNRLLTSRAATEAPLITRARTFIQLHQNEAISLEDTARSVNVSRCYFCKVFKKATGLTFTEYLARARIESVKHRLLDVHTRVSEAAFASGFQSLSQFNRVFLRVAGEAPGRYRGRLRAH